ncbi:MAG: L,D-transpeptidase family protein [Candidatus Paceibacterota bacterium]
MKNMYIVKRFFSNRHRTTLIILEVVLLVTVVTAYILFQASTIRNQSAAELSKELTSTTTPVHPVVPVAPTLFPYIEVSDSCDWSYIGTCINVRSGPGTEYLVVMRLRNGMVLKVAGTVTGEDGQKWYKIEQDATLRYPERVTSDWYVLADTVTLVQNNGNHRLTKGQVATTTKRIVVRLSEEMLYAYDGDTLFMQEPISTGLNLTPTPVGTFTVYAMTPSRYMQGPIIGVSDQAYDLPGVPWNLYFTKDGAVIHGAYWHNNFGQPWSHGCVNLSPENAKKLYLWADIGMKVTVEP